MVNFLSLWRLVLLWSAATMVFSFPVTAQDASDSDIEPESVVPSNLPTREDSKDYLPLLLTGISLTVGGVTGARLSYIEAERWESMPGTTLDRQRRINTWSTVTVVGSVTAAVGVGLVALWAPIRLSQEGLGFAIR